MAKPPPSPPSSDIAGVDRDRVAIDGEHADTEGGEKLDNEREQAKARPKPSRS